LSSLERQDEVKEEKRMSMMRWEPFPELMSLRQAMDRIMEDSFMRPGRQAEGLAPAVDMFQTADEVIVKISVPGVKAEHLDVHVAGDGLTVKGVRTEHQDVKREDYYYQEQRYGAFTRYINLPAGLATEKAEADLQDGVLTLTIPKSEETKPKTIKVKEVKPAESSRKLLPKAKK